MRRLCLSTWIPMMGVCIGVWTNEKSYAEDTVSTMEEKAPPTEGLEKGMPGASQESSVQDGLQAEEDHIRQARMALEKARSILFANQKTSSPHRDLMQDATASLETAKGHMDQLRIRAFGQELFWLPETREPSVRERFEKGMITHKDLFPKERGFEAMPAAREQLLSIAALERAEARADVFRLETIRRMREKLGDDELPHASLYDLWMARTRAHETEVVYNQLLDCNALEVTVSSWAFLWQIDLCKKN